MTEIATKVVSIITDKLGVEESQVTPEASFTNDLGADSLDTVELIMELEKEFDLSIPDEEAEKIVTVGDAIAFIEDFYSHAPEEPGSYDWDEDILKKYLAPAVLDTLHAKVDVYSPGGEAKYATWLLTGIDDSEQVYVSRENFETRRVEDGRYIKRFEVYYWADGMLDGVQELFYTVKSNGEQLFITQIDSLDESGAQQVWDMLEERNRWREMEDQVEEMEDDE